MRGFLKWLLMVGVGFIFIGGITSTPVQAKFFKKAIHQLKKKAHKATKKDQEECKKG